VVGSVWGERALRFGVVAGTSGPEYFDRWYADMARWPAKDDIMQAHLGLPPWLRSNSSLPWQGLDEVTELLVLQPGQVLLDLACGRGGYGLEVAGRTAARLVGVDFSEEALRQAQSTADELGREATFWVGDLASTGLEGASVDAVMCIDAVQFADPPNSVFDEMLRVLRPEGRVVVTCWQAAMADDVRVPARLRRVDLASALTAAGFVGVEVRARPGWRAAERSMMDEAARTDPGPDPALRSLHDEALRMLPIFDALSRVIASAQAP
jgi:SAM-dependent methyltransferase